MVIYLYNSDLRCLCFRFTGTPLALPYQSSLKVIRPLAFSWRYPPLQLGRKKTNPGRK